MSGSFAAAPSPARRASSPSPRWQSASSGTHLERAGPRERVGVVLRRARPLPGPRRGLAHHAERHRGVPLLGVLVREPLRLIGRVGGFVHAPGQEVAFGEPGQAQGVPAQDAERARAPHALLEHQDAVHHAARSGRGPAPRAHSSIGSHAVMSISREKAMPRSSTGAASSG